jgi:MoaA/NifB/PqqE/SkfB family radical SAM enzyme
MKFMFYIKTLYVYFRYKINKPIPFSLFLYPTYKCNQKCNHCYVREKPKKYFEKNLSNNQLIKIVNNASKIGIPSIIISGGEPLLNKNIEDIGFHIKRKGMCSILLTNGNLINKKRAQKIIKSFNIIRISINGLEKKHNQISNVIGSFKKTFNALRLLNKYNDGNLKVVLNIAVNENNIDEVIPISKFFDGLYDSISMIPINTLSGVYSSKKLYDIGNYLHKKNICYNSKNFFFKSNFKLGKENCDQGKLRLNIKPNGDVTLCQLNYSIGNINKTSLYEIHKNVNYNILNKEIKKCKGCYLVCTTQINQIFKKNPIQLLLNFFDLRKKI